MRVVWFALLMGVTLFAEQGFSQTAGASGFDSSTGFPPLDQWRSAVIAGESATLKALYSSEPAAHIQANGALADADADITFWLALKARSMKMEIVRIKERPGSENAISKPEVQTGLPNVQTSNLTAAH